MLGLGKLWGEFKAFAFKGNMIELAVAVILGAAFGKVVTSLTEDIIMPCVTLVVQTTRHTAEAGADIVKTGASKVGIATTQSTTQPTQAEADKAAADKAAADAQAAADKAAADAKTAAAKLAPTEAVNIEWDIDCPYGVKIHIGRFLGSLLNFLIVAFAVFILVVKVMGGVMKRMSKPEKPGEPTTRECPECLSIIPIKAKRCSHCSAEVPPVGTVTA